MQNTPSIILTDNKLLVSQIHNGHETLTALEDFQADSFTQSKQVVDSLNQYWKDFPNSKTTLPAPYQFSFDGQAVIFYGGSFNPFHEGHLECLVQARTNFPDHKIIALPDQNPLKQNHKRSILPHQEYINLVKMLAPLKVEVCPSLLVTEKANPTIDWFEKINTPACLLIGDDNLFNIEQWKSFERLLSLVQDLIVVPRDHSLVASKEKLKKLVQSTGLKKFTLLNEHSFQDVSSTKLRK